ncbi:NAD(P)H-binding protein [Pigmentibacter sp. JX0631]|uniref:NAD(P)H-binding protein n=1 Tax=Pigmentibacter sp. JX0631 TaxID=2976982 RepID=UPI0024699829|nr:NAD(P)H-binding protein [Pigmentibacter sp. JX0631]WGL60929.1 NAD(P)H-binding protein [Pigmentibacter sp. JX0631]
MKNIVVVGASGLVGSNVLALLKNTPDVTVTCLVRHPNKIETTENIKEIVFDFEKEEEYKKIGTDIPCHIFFCCIGTTLRKARSLESFHRVDRDYPIKFVEIIKKNTPNSLFVFISSIGVSNPRGYYLSAKCEVEKAITKSLLHYIIVRPSVLLGKRDEFRLAETVGGFFLSKIEKLTKKFNIDDALSFSKYAPIEASTVAKAMVHHALNFDKSIPGMVLEGDSLNHF